MSSEVRISRSAGAARRPRAFNVSLSAVLLTIKAQRLKAFSVYSPAETTHTTRAIANTNTPPFQLFHQTPTHHRSLTKNCLDSHSFECVDVCECRDDSLQLDCKFVFVDVRQIRRGTARSVRR